MFNRETYQARFINVADVRPDKVKASKLIESQVNAFLASGGKIDVVGFGHSDYKLKSRKQANEDNRRKM